MFIALSGTCIQKFSNRHTPFVFFFSHSVVVAALSGISHVACRAQDIHFLKAFLSLRMQKPLELPNNIIFYIRQLKKIFGALIQER